MLTPSGRKVTTLERKKERERVREKQTPLIVDTMFHDSARNSLGPKWQNIQWKSHSHMDDEMQYKNSGTSPRVMVSPVGLKHEY
jgi:hypothetical protein